MTKEEALDILINALHKYALCGRLTEQERIAIKTLKQFIKD